MRLRQTVARIVAFFLIGLWAQSTPAMAPSAPVSFEAKTITILITSSPGGGTDTTGRLVAQFLPKYLPGNPQTIVQNMPGGGGTIANNHFAANAKPDGLTLLQDSSSALGNFSRGGPRIKYDPRKNKVIGSVGRGGSVLMVRKEVVNSLTDPKARKLVVGDTDGIRTWVAMTVWSAEFLKWNLRWLYGYKGSRELSLAMRQGEIDVWGTQNAKLASDLRKDGVVDIVYQQDEKRRPDFSDIPTFEEYLGASKPKGVPWEAYLAWASAEEVDKFLSAPQKTPDIIVAVLREAFMKMAKDEEFKAQANKFFGEAWELRDGEQTQAKIKEITTISKKAQAYLTQMRTKYGLPVGAPAES